MESMDTRTVKLLLSPNRKSYMPATLTDKTTDDLSSDLEWPFVYRLFGRAVHYGALYHGFNSMAR